LIPLAWNKGEAGEAAEAECAIFLKNKT